MPGCEKCWADAGVLANANGTFKSFECRKLTDERDGSECSPAERCGDLHTPGAGGHCECGVVTDADVCRSPYDVARMRLALTDAGLWPLPSTDSGER